MEYKKILIVLSIILALGVAGCAPGGSADSQRRGDVDFQVGTDGLEISFNRNFFPTEVFETEAFAVGIDIHNKGAYPIPGNGGVMVLGVEDDYVQIPEDPTAWPNTPNIARYATSGPRNNIAIIGDGQNELEGKNPFNPQGEKDQLIIRLVAKELDEREAVHTSTISVNTCYRYQAFTSQSVCIDGDPLNLGGREKSCEVGDISLSSQGGPLAITKVESRMAAIGTGQIKPEFTIHIENKGDGLIVNPDKFETACGGFSFGTRPQEITKEDINRVNITATIPSFDEPSTRDVDEGELDCKPLPLRLTTSQDFVRCQLKNPLSSAGDNYRTVLNINLTYGYQYTISDTFDIKKK